MTFSLSPSFVSSCPDACSMRCWTFVLGVLFSCEHLSIQPSFLMNCYSATVLSFSEMRGHADCPSSSVPLLTPSPPRYYLSPYPITLLMASVSNCALSNEFVLAPIGKASYERKFSTYRLLLYYYVLGKNYFLWFPKLIEEERYF